MNFEINHTFDNNLIEISIEGNLFYSQLFDSNSAAVAIYENAGIFLECQTKELEAKEFWHKDELESYKQASKDEFDKREALEKELEAKDQKLTASRKATHGYIERQDKVIDDQADQLEANKKEIAELNKMLLNAFQITTNGWCVGNHNFDEYLELIKLKHDCNGMLTKEDR